MITGSDLDRVRNSAKRLSSYGDLSVALPEAYVYGVWRMYVWYGMRCRSAILFYSPILICLPSLSFLRVVGSAV